MLAKSEHLKNVFGRVLNKHRVEVRGQHVEVGSLLHMWVSGPGFMWVSSVLAISAIMH